MKIEFDPAKEKKNVEKHGLSLTMIGMFDFSSAKIAIDDRAEYGEVRYGATGYIGGRLYALTFTKRGDAYRPISLRKANERERKKYYGEKKN